MVKSSDKSAASGSPLKGRRLKDFVANLRQAAVECEADSEHRRLAAAKLDFVLKTYPSWDINRRDYPSLPKAPRFVPQPKRGKSYSDIPIPLEHRHLFNNQRKRTKKWQGTGVAAWCHYLAAIEDEVEYFRDPPEAQLRPPIPDSAVGTSEALSQLEGRDNAEIHAMADLYFKSAKAARLPAQARNTMRSQWLFALGYLKRHGRTRVSQIDNNTLDGYRNVCAKLIQKGRRSTKTTNDYLRTFRRMLEWCRDYGKMNTPPFDDLLSNFTDKEVLALAKGAGHGVGARRLGKAEIIAMPVEVMGAWLTVAEKDPFVCALTMCSLNLAAGAADLSDLRFQDDTPTNPLPCVDMKRRLFVTHRAKTGILRWTCQTSDGDYAIPMMDRTHRALTAWLEHRATLMRELADRQNSTVLIQRAATARKLKADGLSYVQIAEHLGVSKGSVAEILKQPGDRRDRARMLAESGYSLRDIVEITGYSKSSVSAYIRDVTPTRLRKPRANRHTIITPNPNRVFFVPDTGRPLVSSETRKDYVRDVFKRVCSEAGIVREADILSKRTPPPKEGTFVLPVRNGHYIFRRTAATVAGMLGGVSERDLQNFLGHRSPEETRKYVRNPPPDYNGSRITPNYRIKLKVSGDPIAALEEFLKVCQSSPSNRRKAASAASCSSS